MKVGKVGVGNVVSSAVTCSQGCAVSDLVRYRPHLI
jgi:hypothetical protein